MLVSLEGRSPVAAPSPALVLCDPQGMLAQVQGDPEEEFLGLRMGCDGRLPMVFGTTPWVTLAKRPQKVVKKGIETNVLGNCAVKTLLPWCFFFEKFWGLVPEVVICIVFFPLPRMQS